jgi:hypothetical protein
MCLCEHNVCLLDVLEPRDARDHSCFSQRCSSFSNRVVDCYSIVLGMLQPDKQKLVLNAVALR